MGVKEVTGVFGAVYYVDEDGSGKQKPTGAARGPPPSLMDFLSPTGAGDLMAGYGAVAGGMGTAGRVSLGSAFAVRSRSAVKSGGAAAKRTASAPPSTVTLQRYPIIPYNPPSGGGVKAEEEVFPKVSHPSITSSP